MKILILLFIFCSFISCNSETKTEVPSTSEAQKVEPCDDDTDKILEQKAETLPEEIKLQGATDAGCKLDETAPIGH